MGRDEARGQQRKRCIRCRVTFGSVGAWDRHDRDGQCIDPARAGLVERHGVWWRP